MKTASSVWISTTLILVGGLVAGPHATAATPNPVEADMRAARDVFHHGQLKSTVRILRDVVQHEPPRGTHRARAIAAQDRALLTIGAIYLGLDKPESALRYIDQAAPGPSTSLLRARAQLGLGDAKGGLKTLQSIHPRYRSLEWAILACGAWTYRGKVRKAREALSAAPPDIPGSAPDAVYTEPEWLLSDWIGDDDAKARRAILDDRYRKTIQLAQALEVPCDWAGKAAPPMAKVR